MGSIRRPALVLTVVLTAVAGLLGWRLAAEARARVVEVGFWFEEVSFRSTRLGHPLTPEDLVRVQAVARAELTRAFDGLRIRVTDNRDARYRVRVVQTVLDARMRRPIHVAGQSRGMAGFGGGGVVNFELLASGAVVYAPPVLDRPGVIDAIGRGIGRAAVHEFTHQLLPRAPIHATRDRSSYEFYSAGRVEQYIGEMRWALAGPLLRARLAR